MNDRFQWPLPRPSLVTRHPRLIATFGPYLGALDRIGALRMRLTENQRRTTRRDHALVLARNLIWGETVENLLDELSAKEVNFIPVKGVVVGETLYPDPGARPFEDLDFLVDQDSLETAERVLTSMGYSQFGRGQVRWDPRHTHHSIFLKPQCPAVELHFRLAHELACVTSLDGFFEASQTGTLRGRTVRMLNPEDQMVYLLTHAATHGLLCGAHWALDVALLLAHHPELDLLRVASQLETRKLGPAGAAGLNLVCKLFPSVARDAAPLQKHLNRRWLCAAIECVVGQLWWGPAPTGRSIPSLLARALLHPSAMDLATTLALKIQLSLVERATNPVTRNPSRAR